MVRLTENRLVVVFLLEVIQKSNNEIALSSTDITFSKGICVLSNITSSMEIWELASPLFVSAQSAVQNVNTTAVLPIEEAESIPLGGPKQLPGDVRKPWDSVGFFHMILNYLSTGCMDFQSESAVVAPIAFRCFSDRSLSTVLGELLPSTSLLLDCGIMLSLQRCQVWSAAR